MKTKNLARKVPEKELRNWLAAVYPERVRWVEPTRGSSVGLPDAEVDLYAGWKLPLELKSCYRLAMQGDTVNMRVRPAQRRYHILAKQNNQKTAFLLLENALNPFSTRHATYHVVLVNGAYGSHNDFITTGHMFAGHIARYKGKSEATPEYYAKCRQQMEDLLAEAEFWEQPKIRFENGKMRVLRGAG